MRFEVKIFQVFRNHKQFDLLRWVQKNIIVLEVSE